MAVVETTTSLRIWILLLTRVLLNGLNCTTTNFSGKKLEANRFSAVISVEPTTGLLLPLVASTSNVGKLLNVNLRLKGRLLVIIIIMVLSSISKIYCSIRASISLLITQCYNQYCYRPHKGKVTTNPCIPKNRCINPLKNQTE